MKKHMIISLLAYFFWGFGLAVQLFGIKAGLGFWTTTIIWIVCAAFFIISVFTSLQVLKDFIEEHDKTKTIQP